MEQSPNGSSSWAAVSGSPLAANTTSKTVTGLNSGTTYYFRIRSNSAGGSSAYSSTNGNTIAPTETPTETPSPTPSETPTETPTEEETPAESP